MGPVRLESGTSNTRPLYAPQKSKTRTHLMFANLGSDVYWQEWRLQNDLILQQASRRFSIGAVKTIRTNPGALKIYKRYRVAARPSHCSTSPGRQKTPSSEISFLENSPSPDMQLLKCSKLIFTRTYMAPCGTTTLSPGTPDNPKTTSLACS